MKVRYKKHYMQYSFSIYQVRQSESIRSNPLRSITKGVHISLVKLLKGEHIPSKERVKDDIAAYRKINLLIR